MQVETATYRLQKVELNKERPANGSLTRKLFFLEQCQKH